MRFDTVIIGGGLAGLVCGIRLQKAGKKCAIVSSGQNAMHFSSGSFDLLGKLPDGTPVEDPIKAIPALGNEHPYSILGAETVEKYAAEAVDFFNGCGVPVYGDAHKNTWRITPTGERKPAWLKLSDFSPFETQDSKVGEKILIVNILGYLDFNTNSLLTHSRRTDQSAGSYLSSSTRWNVSARTQVR